MHGACGSARPAARDPARRYGRRRYRPAHVKVLLLVNSSASSVTARGRVVIQKALSADHDVDAGRDQPPGPRHPPRAGRGRRRHRRRRGARRRRHAERGGQRAGRHRHRARRRCPAARPTCSPARSACPTTRSRPPATLLDALGRGSIRRVGLGSVNGRYFLSTSAWASTPPSSRRSSGAPAQALRRPPAVRLRRRSTPGSATTTASGRASRSTYADGTVVDDGYFAVCLNTDPYTFLGNRPLDLAPEADPRPRARDGHVRTPATCRRIARRGSRGARRRPRRAAGATTGRTARDLDGLTRRGHGPFPYQVDGDYLGESPTRASATSPTSIDLVLP